MASMAYEQETRQLLDTTAVTTDKTIVFDEEYEGVVQVLARWYRSGQDAIFWFYMNVKDDVTISTPFAVLLNLFVYLQFIGFAFFPFVNYPWSDSMTNVVSKVTRSVSKFPSKAGSIDQFILATCFCVAFFLFFFFAGISCRKLRWMWPIVASRFLLRVLCNVFYVPILDSLCKMLFGCTTVAAGSGGTNPFYPAVKCWAGMHILYTIVSIILMLALLWLCILTEGTFFDQDPNPRSTTKTFGAKSTGRGAVLSLIVRFILVLLFSATHMKSARIPLAVVMVLLGLAMAGYHWRLLPHYDDISQGLEFFTALSLSWLGVCCFFVALFNDKQEGTAMLFYTFLPVLLILSLLLVRARYAYVESLRDHNLSAPHLFELRARVLIRSMRRDSWLYYDPTDADTARVRDCHIETEHVFQRGVQRFPLDPYLHIMFACFFIYIVDNKVLAYGEAQACDNSRPSYDLRFLVFYYRRLLDKGTAAAQSSEVQSYMEFKSRKEIADACVRAAAKALFQFWTELLRPAPDINALSTLGHTARQAMSRATINYEKLLQINPNSIPVLRSFGTFMVDLLGDAARANMLFTKAEQVEEIRAKTLSANMQRGDFLQRLETNLDIFDDRNAVFGVAIDRQHLGEIESVNISGRRQFGYAQASDLVGHNIHKVIPSPLAEIHDDLLVDFLNRNESRILNTTRVAFALHKAGHIFPINLFIRWADQANGKMVGVLQAIDDSRDVHLMIDSRTRAVDYCTTPCYPLFGFTRERLSNKEVYIHDILPVLFDRDDVDRTERAWEQIGTKAGLSCSGRNIFTREEFPLQAWIISVVVASTTITFVRLHVEDYFDEADDSDTASLGDAASADLDAEGGIRRRHADDSDDENNNGNGNAGKSGAGGGAGSRGQGGQGGSASAGPMSTHGKQRGLLAGLADDGGGSENSSAFSSQPGAPVANAHTGPHGLGSGVTGAQAAAGARARAAGKAEADARVRKKRMAQARRDRALAGPGDVVALGGMSLGATSASGTETDLDRESRATGDTSSSTGSTGGSGRKGHKRLMRVIENENIKTSAGLTRMSRFFLFLVAMTLICSIIIYVVSTTYINRIDSQISYLRESAHRAPVVQAGTIATRTYTLVAADSIAALTLPSSTTPVTEASLRTDAEAAMTQAADTLSDAPTHKNYLRTSAMKQLDDRPVLGMSLRLDNSVVKDYMGLLQATFVFISLSIALIYAFTMVAAGHHSPLSPHSSTVMHSVLANGMNTLPEAYAQSSAFARRAIDTESRDLLVINIVMATVAVVTIVAVLVFLVRPIILYIEQGKAQVLAIFLDIPRQTRRTLRRRVYSLMKEEGEESIDVIDAPAGSGRTGSGGLSDDELGIASPNHDDPFSGVASALGAGGAGGGASSAAEQWGDRGTATQRYHRSRNQQQQQQQQQQQSAGRQGDAQEVNLAKITTTLRTKAQQSAERAGGASASGPGGASAAMGAAGAGTSLAEEEEERRLKEDKTRQEKADQQRMAVSTSERAMRILFAKYSFLVIFVLVYMIVVVVLTAQRINNASYMATTVEYSARRLPLLQRGYFYLREHLFTDYADVLATQPLSPLLTPSPYSEEAMWAMESFAQYHHAIVFGDSSMGLRAPPFDTTQNNLLYRNGCGVPPSLFPLPKNYAAQCPTFGGGLVANGLQAAVLSAENTIAGLAEPALAGVFAPLTGGAPNPNYPPNTPAFDALVDSFRELNGLVTDFITPGMEFSTRLYTSASVKYLNDFQTFRVVFLVCFIVLLLILYVAIYNPIVQKLNVSARQTRAMMLVLPPDVVKVVASVQKLIADNMQQ